MDFSLILGGKSPNCSFNFWNMVKHLCLCTGTWWFMAVCPSNLVHLVVHMFCGLMAMPPICPLGNTSGVLRSLLHWFGLYSKSSVHTQAKVMPCQLFCLWFTEFNLNKMSLMPIVPWFPSPALEHITPSTFHECMYSPYTHFNICLMSVCFFGEVCCHVFWFLLELNHDICMASVIKWQWKQF